MINLVSMVKVIVPTLNAANDWAQFAPALLSSVQREQVLIVDSGSTDGTIDLARTAGFQTHSIARSEFNHGGTRHLAVKLLADAEILVFMTQDAVLADPDAVANLVAVFRDSQVGAAYGRQLPRRASGAIERHARTFSYPAVSDLRDLASRERLGFKAIFISNAFAAYRRSALIEVGGFPSRVIFGEDTITAARLLLASYKVAYVAEAKVYHSHGYTWMQEFRRYFDIGVFHGRENWLLREFGQASGEGKRFVLSELAYLLHNNPALIPSSLIRTGLKFLGYRLGRKEALLSPGMKKRLSMHARFWDQGAPGNNA